MFSFYNPGQYFGPAEMLAVYQNLPVDTPGGAAAVAITQYRNYTKGSCDEGIKVGAYLHRAAPDAYQRAGGSGLYGETFMAKGAPQAIAGVLQTFVDYADAFVNLARREGARGSIGLCADLLNDSSLSWQDTLQQISDNWLGLDCNGFVGNWLKVVIPEAKLNQNSKTNDVLPRAKAIRSSVDEIDYWDIVCYADNKHIAAINLTPNWGTGPGIYQVCQSAGGGPRMNDFRILTAGTDNRGRQLFRLAAPSANDDPNPFYVASLW